MNIYIWISILLVIIIIICYVTSLIKYKPNKNINEIKPETIVKRIQIEPEQDEKRQEEQIIVKILPPEIENMKKILNDFIENIDKWDCLIAMGDIYRKGAYPRFLPNENIAMECFKIAAMSPDGDIAGLGQVKYIEARTELINNEDKKGEPFPEVYGINICNIAIERIKNIPFSFTKPRIPKEKDPIRITTIDRDPIGIEQYPNIFNDFNDFNNFNNFNTNIEDDMFLDIANLNEQHYIPQQRTAYKSDAQNVHDHAIVSIAKKNLEELSKDKEKSNNDKVLEKVRMSILNNSELTDKQSSDALLVLDKLGNTTHYSFGVSEQDILSTVWNKISNEKDDTLKNNLVETLGKQLASGVENGSVVCSTGKIVRILGTLDGIEDEKIETVKPLWAIKEEISTLASKIRDRHINNLSESEKVAYERNELSNLDEIMKNDFHNQVTDIYINNLKMNEKIINPIIQMYKDAY